MPSLDIVTTDSRVEIEASLTMERIDEDDKSDNFRNISTKTSEETRDAENNTSSSVVRPESEPKKPVKGLARYSFAQRQAMRMARNPCTHFWVALICSIVLSIVGLTVGDFKIAIDNAGWQSRKTLIANRHSQFALTWINRRELWRDENGEYWDELINNIQPGWELGTDESERRLLEAQNRDSGLEVSALSQDAHQKQRQLPFQVTPEFARKLQNLRNTSVIQGCDISWYSEDMVNERHLWPIWRIKDKSEPNALLSENSFYDLCVSEEKTQQVLKDNGLCNGCSNGNCLPPYSLVFFARVTLTSGLYMNCDDLAVAWTKYNAEKEGFEDEIVQCAEDMEQDYQPFRDGADLPDSCPNYFSAVLLDGNYDESKQLRYTSSIFSTPTSSDDLMDIYNIVPKLSQGENGYIEGKYDTQYEDLNAIEIDNGFQSDMLLAAGSGIIALVAIFVHTRSPLLTIVGVLQIALSIPLAYFVYTFIGRLEFFPFLNFIGVFVVVALGADDIFVAVDKWKNARLEHGNEIDTEEIAAIALPDAAGAMFLTTLTTAIAFFGTAICPVAPILCFAIYCGLLIVMDYILCVILVLPMICYYDRNRHRSNCFFRFCHPTVEQMQQDSDERPSLIRRILSVVYFVIHKTRYVLVAICLGAFITSIVFASKLQLPLSADVRLLRSNNHFEKNFLWRKNLVFDQLVQEAGSSTFVLWGLKPADTGDRTNPESFTQLVLDESFEPSKWQAQIYMRDFCDKIFENEWAEPTDQNELCPINEFDEWLKQQFAMEYKEQSEIYRRNCGGANGLPLAEGNFDACIYNWGQESRERFILARNGKVRIMFFLYRGRIRFDSPHSVTDKEWHTIEAWFNDEREIAPEGANNMYFTSQDYWWYDTNGSMLGTAYYASAIALAAASLVILVSSRSFVLTLFSAYTIGFVLASVTAILVALGWTLGFLEAICFAILIGISCDFVIHFSHSYAALPGMIDRHTRTKFALISMGPSILAAAFTTLAAATVMLFTVISFFVKFAVILFATIIMATLGSFIVFVALADTFGPSQPTYIVDWLVAKCSGKENLKKSDKTEQAGDQGIRHVKSGETETSAMNIERTSI